MTVDHNWNRIWLVIANLLLISAGFAFGQDIQAIGSAEDAKLSNRIQSLNNLPADDKSKVSVSLQKESIQHFGFPAFKSVGDLMAIDVSNLPEQQKSLVNTTVMHVVETNLPPVAILKNAIKPTGTEIYPDLDTLVKASFNSSMITLANEVGRIRYWVRNDQPATSMKDSDAYLAGTGFVVGPGMIATACHVLDAITDSTSTSLSSTLWIKIDFSADSLNHQAYLVTGVLGRGSLQGEDYAILSVSNSSEGGGTPLPDPVILGVDSGTQYIGVVGYPDIDGAVKACASGGSGCDETAKWFVAFAQKNPGVIKVISPGRKTGDFSPHGFPILTYDAPTLEGQSGSPVIDMDSDQVVGLHYCCTGYTPDTNEPTCAKLQPLSLGDKSDNEALAIRNVVIKP